MLGLIGLLIVVFTGWRWLRLIEAVAVPRDRRLYLASFAGGGLIGLAGALGGGWLSIVSGGLAALLGLGFASLRLLSGQAPNRPTVGVGEPMLAFSAPDADGAVFDSESLSGRPYLLKFFRGHW